ncbi:MAG: extracellular solute-binding protein [Oscillospiraceae bacterium]|nr:extracellular solute-binding protein [Oscillospiraceae bacterium]MDY6208049.1 extracellular solute-binding protein [Oscillospiraceae bacterium]
MKLKKILSAVLAVSMMAAVTGCGGSTEGGGTTEQAAGETQAAEGADDADDSDDADNSAAENDTEAAEGSSGDVREADEDFSELYGKDTINITIYSQLANYSGELTGWFAELMKQKYNCVMTIIPDSDGTFDTRMESGNLGDIVVFGSTGNDYQRAATSGMLFDWNEDDILSDYGPYIKANMPYALENNANLNDSIGAGNVVYGFGHNVATSPEDHEAFFYTMDLRWDLYKELGYPEVNNLDDLYNLFVSMKEICPTDEAGNETYAISMWPDWDGNMVMYIKAFATCYWGYDEMGFGLYDVETGKYHDALEPDGPYLKSLKFFNKLYQAGLIDPNSITQTYDKMSEKAQNGGIFFSIFDYAGSQLYNSEEHLTEGKGMYPMVPKDASPLCYGMNVMGGNRVWTIGANTEYPELCMAIINYLTTPEGYMTYWYGPKDVCWYYDEEGHSCLTELGEQAYKDRKGTIMPAEWGGISFNEGTFQANNTTWSRDASNPDSNGETYNCDNWVSRRADTDYEIQNDWRTRTGCYNSQEYMNTTNYKVSLATSYSESAKSDELEIVWEQVKNTIVTSSWNAVYAESDEEFDKIVADMTAKCKEYDPEGVCLAWCENEAAIRCGLEDQVR